MKSQRSHDEISALCLELALFLRSGLDTASGLSLLAQEEDAGDLKELLAGMADGMDRGKTLSLVFRETEQFPEYVCGLIAVGEQTGHLEEALRALSRYYEHRSRLDRHLRSALMYPVVLLLIMLVMIVVLLTKVLPVFEDVYAALGGQLTGVAGGLLALGQVLDAAMPVLCVVLALAVILVAVFAGSGSFRTRVLSLWRKRGGDRGVSRKLNMARFAQALAMGVDSGLTVEESLTLASALLEDIPAAKRRCQECREKLDAGMSLAHAMNESGLIPAAECRLLELGVRSGCHDAVMAQIAERLSEEGDAALEARMNQIEPVLVVIASVLVGAILMSVMLPLMNIMTVIG